MTGSLQGEAPDSSPRIELEDSDELVVARDALGIAEVVCGLLQ